MQASSALSHAVAAKENKGTAAFCADTTGSFYRPLARREREPQTAAQEQFVGVCEGRIPTRTAHEFAYLDLNKFADLSGITEEQA